MSRTDFNAEQDDSRASSDAAHPILHTADLFRGSDTDLRRSRDADVHGQTSNHSRRPTVVMLHGWGQDMDSLRVLADLLSAYYPVHLVDLPGFGKSGRHDGSWGSEEYAGYIYAHLSNMKLTNNILVGHSYGSRVALRLAYKHPDIVQSLVLIAAAGLQPTGANRTRRDIKLFFNRFLKNKFVSRDYANAGPLRRTLVKAVTEDLSNCAKSIKTKTLLIYGNKDTETPPELGQRFNGLIPNSSLIELAQKDHFPFVGAGASLCAWHILKFLAQTES